MPDMQTPAPPPSPIQGADEQSHSSIHITCVIKKAYKQIPFDSSKPWKLCRVPVHQIEPKNSPWDQIRSAQGISVAGTSYDGTFYRVAVNEEYLPWLRFHEYKFELDLEPLKPVEAEVRCQGIWVATCNAEDRFLKDVVEEIFSGCGPGPESSYREIVLPRQQSQFEWASLSHDVLESHWQIQERFAKRLEFISLNLLNDYDTPPALELLRKDQCEVLQVFREVRRSLSNWRPRISVAKFETQNKSKKSCDIDLHWISIIRNVLELCGGRKNFLQKHFDPDFSAIDNANLCAALVDISGSNPFGKFDVQKMRNALTKSKLFANDDMSTLEIGTLTIRMMNFLPFEYPRHLDLPAEILGELGDEQVNLIRVQIAHIYHQYPSLQRPENDVLVLLVWSSTDPIVHRVVTKWVFSDDSWGFYEGMIRDVQKAQENEQLGLTLAALLCHRRILSPTPMHTTKPINGSYLLDFDSLINGKPLDNTRTVLERMILSVFRVLESRMFKNNFRNLRHFLATALHTNIAIPIQHPFDALSDRYWVQRTWPGLNHEGAFRVVGLQHVMKMTAGLNVYRVGEETIVENEEKWVMVPLADSMGKLRI